MKNCIETHNLITVSKYAKRKKLDRQLIYYYIKKKLLIYQTIGGVLFIDKNTELPIIGDKNNNKIIKDFSLSKREQKAQDYLKKNNIRKIK